MLLVLFKLLFFCWRLDWVNPCERVNLCAAALHLFWVASTLIFTANVGAPLPGTGDMGCGAQYGAGTPHSSWSASAAEIFSWLLTTTRGCGASPFCISPPSYQSPCGCCIICSVVGIQFSLSSSGSKGSLFFSYKFYVIVGVGQHGFTYSDILTRIWFIDDFFKEYPYWVIIGKAKRFFNFCVYK